MLLCNFMDHASFGKESCFWISHYGWTNKITSAISGVFGLLKGLEKAAFNWNWPPFIPPLIKQIRSLSSFRAKRHWIAGFWCFSNKKRERKRETRLFQRLFSKEFFFSFYCKSNRVLSLFCMFVYLYLLNVFFQN